MNATIEVKIVEHNGERKIALVLGPIMFPMNLEKTQEVVALLNKAMVAYDAPSLQEMAAEARQHLKDSE